MQTKRSKGYVPYLYTWTKHESITAYFNKKKGGGAYIIATKVTLNFKNVSKEYTKQRQTTQKDKIKEESIF